MLGFARFGALLAALGFLVTLTGAQSGNNTVPASTFWIAKTETQFSLSISNSTDDVYIYFASPAYSWVAVGFGAKMENSLMFVMYPDNTGNGITVSPRIGGKDVEPVFAPSIKLDLLPGTTNDNNESMLILKAKCSNCRSWANGVLDVKNKAHPMIYAFGPGNTLQSNSRSADLKRHVRYGHFTMDMVAATGNANVPPKSSAPNGVVVIGAMVEDKDRINHAHAVMGCIAIFVIWPLNVLFAGFLKNIRIHVGATVLMMLFLVIAYALGIATSAEYNRSKDYKTPHQILAFLTIAPILLMSLLPIPSLARINATLPRLHTTVALVTFLLLILVGGLGLNLSMQIRPLILVYTAVSLIVFVFIASIQVCIKKRGSAHARANRKRTAEHDDKHFMLQQMQERSGSQSSREFGADGQRGPVGQGTMPGPQYLLNMHPGVPVNRW